MSAAASSLAPEMRAMLADVLARYEAAQLGELNVTADALRDACRACGWPGGYASDYLPWARAVLGRAT